MAQKRGKKQSKAARARAQKQRLRKRQTTAVLLFGLALLMLFFAIIEGESLWTVLHNVMFGLFGFCAYLVPLLLGFIAVMLAIKKDESIALKVGEGVGFIILLNTAIVIFSISVTGGQNYFEYIGAAYKSGIKLTGGVVGAILGYPLQYGFGSLGAKIIICILVFVLLMLVTGTTLGKLFRATAAPVKKLREVHDRLQEEAEEREEYSKPDPQPQPRRRARFNVDVPLSDENVPGAPESVKEESLDEKRQRMLDVYNNVAAKHNSEIEIVATAEKEQSPQKPKEEKASSAPVATGVIIETAQENVYHYPPVSLLRKGNTVSAAGSQKQQQATAQLLVDTLLSFGVETRLLEVSRGPRATRYELQPAAGVKISKITGLSNDIALSLAAESVRIEAPIPGKAAVGIEVPNAKNDLVTLRDIIETPQFSDAKSKLVAALGRDISGNNVVVDISKMPHLLIAGTTGSGKSVCTKSMILSILYKSSPDDVKFIMIDPKQVELTVFNGIPHLLVPVVTDPRKAAGALGWAVTEMEKRYKLLHDNKVANLKEYNEFAKDSETLEELPQIVVVIDELADLMMTTPKEVEDSICRLAQKARAAGMHLIIATQRPEAKVITGLIKANIPSRIALHTTNAIDSRIILDTSGAEKLLGHGDMLYSYNNAKPTRVQGCFVDTPEVKAVVEFIKANAEEAVYDEKISAEIEKQAVRDKSSDDSQSSGDSNDGDPRLNEAIEVAVECGSASTSLLQRRLKLGYAHAARIVDEMERRGIVGPFEGSKPRKVLITKDQWLEMKASGEDN
jgi:S-DNA-T family DNA segregation ATPase FtsK/SpoIIIE